MDTSDRPDKMLPARRPATAALRPALPDLGGDPAGAASASRGGDSFSPRVIWRAFRRHWWQAVLLWLIGSAGLIAAAYTQIKPTFDAHSQIRVENTSYSILTEKNVFAPTDFAQYMETLVATITNPTVIDNALAKNPDLLKLPMLAGVPDPDAVIRKALRVSIRARTNLIDINLSSKEPHESGKIVNAVVDSFLKLSDDVYSSATSKQIKRLKDEKQRQQDDVARRRKEIEELTKTVNIAALDRIKDRNVSTIDSYKALQEERTRVEIERIKAESILQQVRNEKLAPTRPNDDVDLNDAIAELFYEDPKIAMLQQERERIAGRLEEAERLSRNPADPARVKWAEAKADIDRKINDQWRRMEPKIRLRLAATPVDEFQERRIAEAEANLSALKTQENILADRLGQVKIENREAENEALKLEFMRQDLASANDVLKRVSEALDQLEFDSRSPVARIELNFPAAASTRADGNLRTQVMLLGPAGLAAMLLLGLLLLERWGARVGDPDELSDRMKLKVIGTIPPLPQIRASSSGGPGANGNGNGGGGGPGANGNGNGNALVSNPDARSSRQLDEFVQSLDHLRVALCARRDPWGRDRHCVLITSACGSEGKTTLSAQLAERCINAGQTTLVIDADLRNPTLSRMLDAAENPGLINVLRGEVLAEDVIMVIGDAGGFHLIPAGNPRMDPSRLLASDRLAKLIAQARESYDMIIIDVPPVLPVPDALTIGRLTDGAVLVVRYDRSRFPLVERAHSRLAHVGVPILGAVLNGVRSASSYYGYGYGSYGGYGTTYYGSVDPAPSGDDASPSADATPAVTPGGESPAV